MKYLVQLNITDWFLDNVLTIAKFYASENLKKLREPVDKNRWLTDPAVVNAFYNPNKNDIGKFNQFYCIRLTMIADSN